MVADEFKNPEFLGKVWIWYYGKEIQVIQEMDFDVPVKHEEISCTGCKPENWCRYRVVKCCMDRCIETCADCREYPCDNMKECFEVTKSFIPKCCEVCTDEEYQLIEVKK